MPVRYRPLGNLWRREFGLHPRTHGVTETVPLTGVRRGLPVLSQAAGTSKAGGGAGVGWGKRLLRSQTGRLRPRPAGRGRGALGRAEYEHSSADLDFLVCMSALAGAGQRWGGRGLSRGGPHRPSRSPPLLCLLSSPSWCLSTPLLSSVSQELLASTPNCWLLPSFPLLSYRPVGDPQRHSPPIRLADAD